MLNIDASIHRIRAYAAHMGWSAEKYGEAAGVPASTARDVLKDRGNPTRATIRAMESVIPNGFLAPTPRRKRLSGASSHTHSHGGAL